MYQCVLTTVIYRPLGYERVYLPLYKVADTPFHIQGDDIYTVYTMLKTRGLKLYYTPT